MSTFNANFVIEYKENMLELSEDIIVRLFVSRIQQNKNSIILVTGRSGEGKSRLAIRIAEICARHQNWSLHNYLDTVLMFTPIDYQRGMKKILYEPEYKDVNIAILDEARVLVDKAKWQTFVNQTIGHVNAMVRGIKRMIFIIVTQSPKDIDSSVRRTADFWIQCRRPMNQPTEGRIYYFYEDTRNIEDIKLKIGKVKGLLKMPDGRMKAIKPQKFKFYMPSRELDDAYQKLHDEKKGRVLQAKIDQLAKAFEKDEGSSFTRIDSLIQWIFEKTERQTELVKKVRGKLRLLPHAKKNFDLTDSEVDYFDKKMNEVLTEKNKQEIIEVVNDGHEREPAQG